MDSFQDQWWNLDQLRAWAQTRDPELVRAAAQSGTVGQERDSAQIALRALHAATELKRRGRDIEAELWEASKWERPRIDYFVPSMIDRMAQERGISPFRLFDATDVEVRWPVQPETVALISACSAASEHDKTTLANLIERSSADIRCIVGDPAFNELPAALNQLIRGVALAREVQGPPQVIHYAPFPIEDYLLHLFRTGRMTGSGNLPGEALARAITPQDWRGLEIRVGGDTRRLAVWIIGRTSVHRAGDIENVRISRDEILKEFPADAPKPTGPKQALDDVLLEAANQTETGTLTQTSAIEHAKKRGVYTNRKGVLDALRSLKIQGKQGRTKKRRDTA
ncbi:MAG: hypothetical protein WAU78_13780 [Roseiarcus sp.]